MTSGTEAGAPELTTDHDVWFSLLHRMQADVAAAEDLLRRLHDGDDVPDEAFMPAWTPPVSPGEVPGEFLDWARSLAQRQLEVGLRLAEAMVMTRSGRRAITKLEPAESRPVFIDQAL